MSFTLYKDNKKALEQPQGLTHYDIPEPYITDY